MNEESKLVDISLRLTDMCKTDAKMSITALSPYQIQIIIEDGDKQQLQKRITNGDLTDINWCGDKSPLKLAVESGHVDIAELLLDNCAEINIYKLYQSRVASDLGDVSDNWKFDSKYLNKAVNNSYSLLQIACSLGNVDMIKLLLKRGIYIDDDVLFTCLSNLHISLKSDQDKCEIFIPQLVERIKNINFRHQSGGTFLHRACIDNNICLLKTLIARRVDLTAVNQFNHNVLRVAAGLGHHEIVQLLLDTNTSTLISKDQLKQALLAAARHMKLEVVRILTDRGIGADVLTTALAAVCGNETLNFEIIECLLIHGADVYATEQGCDIWCSFVSRFPSDRPQCDDEYNDYIISIWQLFLEYNADANLYVTIHDMHNYIIRNSSQSLLVRAWGFGRNAVKLSTILLDHGADINLPLDTTTGQSILMSAAERSYIDLVKLYLEYGADVMYMNNNGETVLDILERLGDVLQYVEIKELCIQAMTKPVLK